MADIPTAIDLLSGEENEQLVANWHRLSALYGAHAPHAIPGPVNPGRWEPYALACLARGHYALQSVVALAHRQLDAAVMLRVAYEHLVTFAWLMIDAPSHYPQLLRTDLIQRRKMRDDLDANAIGEISFEPIDAAVAELERFASKNDAPGLPDRAKQADNYWSRFELPEASVGWSFRHGYASAYRPNSAYVHPTLMGLFAFVTVEGFQYRVGAPVPERRVHPVAEAARMLADALIVASYTFGWPPTRDVVFALTHGFELAQHDGDKETRDA